MLKTTRSSSTAAKSVSLPLVCQSQKHAFHILDASPYPFLVSFFLLFLLIPTTLYMHTLELPFALPRADLMHLSFFGLYLTAMSWFISIIKESSQGFHTSKVQHGLRMGMLLFILSEVMLFFAFFWGFFHFSLVPAVTVGSIWPPEGTQHLNVWGLPLVNTLLLLTSGLTITIAHAYILRSNADGFAWYLFLTILLGVTFLFCQAYEYKYGVKFSWRENIYGSIFFITTGFHGMHVTIGTLFLTFCWVRHFLATTLPADMRKGIASPTVVVTAMALNYHPSKGRVWAFQPRQHFGFEAAAWYWHFVDVVWLFLFLTIYWWGGA
jgi:heme/copper-type cytochrome/quinol oxidase subunit 3